MVNSGWINKQLNSVFRIFIFTVVLSSSVLANSLLANELDAEVIESQCLIGVEISGVIGASTLDLVERVKDQAIQEDCVGYLLRINTPGGNLQTTRLIVQAMLASERPFLCLVTPAGAQAGSAGAILMQACHLSAALPTTNIGAATPISGTGQEMSEDLRNKIINDTVSWLEGVTKTRGRNLEFSRKIVTEAQSVTATEAVRLGAIDYLVESEQDFLARVKDKKLSLPENRELTLKELSVNTFDFDIRYKVLQQISDPEISYLLFMGSLALIYFEVTHPGTIVPGVLGSIGLVLALVSFHKMEVYWGGVALVFLGLVLFILEMFVTSFGMLGLGGLVAFVLGSILLFDIETTGYSLSLSLILPIALALAGLLLGMMYLMLQTRKTTQLSDQTQSVGAVVEVLNVRSENAGQLYLGQVKWKGEIWHFQSTSAVAVGDRVRVQKLDGLTLIVEIGSAKIQDKG